MKQPRQEVFSQSVERVMGKKIVKIPDRNLEKSLKNQAADNNRLLEAENVYRAAMQAGVETSNKRLNEEIDSRQKIEVRLDSGREEKKAQLALEREAAIAKSMAEMKIAREADDAVKRQEIKKKFGIE